MPARSTACYCDLLPGHANPTADSYCSPFILQRLDFLMLPYLTPSMHNLRRSKACLRNLPLVSKKSFKW
jgi:hypothetical protein